MPFLHVNIKKKMVYMEQPLGFIHSSYSNHVRFMKKSIYGFKQAPIKLTPLCLSTK